MSRPRAPATHPRRAPRARARREARRHRLDVPLAVSLLALAAAFVAGLAVGTVPIGPAGLARAVAHGFTGAVAGPADVIVWQLRVPRACLAGVVGACLALAGATFQGVFRNALADPYLLGAASGAGFGAAVVLAFAGAVPWLAGLGVPLASFIAALATVALVVLLGSRGRALPAVSLILAGVVVGSSLTAATSFVLLAAREQAAGILAWLLGSFTFASWGRLAAVLPLALPALLLAVVGGRALDVLQLGEESAAQLGLPVETVKIVLLAAATLATAAAVSVAGIIGFVGLVVPHAVRLAFGPGHRRLLPLSAVWGALFLILADLLSRTVLAPAEVPVGIVTALVGGPVFLALLRRQGARP